MNEEEIKFNYITPAIEKAGWDKKQIKMEYIITDGKISLVDNFPKREQKLKADYVLFYKTNIPIAVIEAKSDSHNLGDGMQQAQNYAKKLDVRFVFTSNGKSFLFYDMVKGLQEEIDLNNFPSPEELFSRQYSDELKNYPNVKKLLDTPYYFGHEFPEPRYYQSVAINRTINSIALGKNKILLVMATGTGKTYVAFQIIWKLWKSGIVKKILYLADRNILLDQTISGDFKPFKNSLYKISKRNLDRSYEIYLSLYHQLSENNDFDNLDILKKNFNTNFFDLIIVDECHRGSARENSSWRKILDYFDSAIKIGMTATPKETKDISNINYFGEPIYVYSLKNGIDDGYLAPYKVFRYAIDKDVFGYIPEQWKTDVEGNKLEKSIYYKEEFDRKIVIKERTEKVAEQITNFLKETDRYAKTIVFCMDIEHAERMRQALVKYNSDLCSIDNRYVMRITGDDDEGKKQLENFIDKDSLYPTIVTTSKLLTTGVNCITCKNIVLDNIFGENGLTEFKQIIGRGTRIDESYGKMFFNILDFRNAYSLFNDIDFNGSEIQESKNFSPELSNINNKDDENSNYKENILDSNFKKNKKIYVDNVWVEILSESVSYLDENQNLVNEKIENYAKKRILKYFNSIDDFLKKWLDSNNRTEILKEFEEKGIFISELRKKYSKNIDDFDLVCNVAYGLAPKTKSERISQKKVKDLLNSYENECKNILKIILDKYSENLISDINDITILKLNDFNKFGGLTKVINLFGGIENYLEIIKKFKRAIYQ